MYFLTTSIGEPPVVNKQKLLDQNLYHIEIKGRNFWAIAQPKFISPLPLGYALHTLEEGDFFRKFVKKRNLSILRDVPFMHQMTMDNNEIIAPRPAIE